jgi:hypothetical protein
MSVFLNAAYSIAAVLRIAAARPRALYTLAKIPAKKRLSD